LDLYVQVAECRIGSTERLQKIDVDSRVGCRETGFRGTGAEIEQKMPSGTHGAIAKSHELSTELLQLGIALHIQRRFAYFLDRGQKQPDQYRDDRNYHQHFDESETCLPSKFRNRAHKLLLEE
jgi:hypothetical protein